MEGIQLKQVNDFKEVDDTNRNTEQCKYVQRTLDNPVSNDISEHSFPVQENKPQLIEMDSGRKSCLANTQVKKKKSNRVSFPENSLVSGSMDPPDPWHHATNCTTNILVESYKNTCERHNVKPLPRLLSQLMAVNNFQDRNETLTLRGEKMDTKHCETLEEVFRRVQFRLVDLEGTHLEEEGVIALFDMIEYYQSCTKLNISFNKNLGLRGWQACARLLKKTPCLEYLDARSCNLTEQTMATIGRSIRIGSFLHTLHLENSYLSGRLLLILVAAVKMNESLRELFLADNRLMPSDGIQLGNLLKFNHKLQLLDIRNNHLQDVGTGHLCDGLHEQSQGSGLNTLVLWNNQITYQAMTALTRAIISTKSLETLNLGHNNLTNEGIHRLKEGLLQNKSLLRVGIQACKVTCEGAVALAEFLAESKRLLRIDVRENDIKTGGLMALALALKVSTTVTRIDVDKEAKKENGVKDYAETQKQLLSDINVYLQRNRDTARELEEAQQAAEREKQRLLLEEEAKRLQQEEEEAEMKAMEEEEEELARKIAQESEGRQEADKEPASSDVTDAPQPDTPATNQLNLPLDSLLFPRQQTLLESPEFMPEEVFTIQGIELAVEAGESGATYEKKEEVMRPVSFKDGLPPLITDGLLSPLSQSAPSPPLSPNARKFIISKVLENKKPSAPKLTSEQAFISDSDKDNCISSSVSAISSKTESQGQSDPALSSSDSESSSSDVTTENNVITPHSVAHVDKNVDDSLASSEITDSSSQSEPQTLSHSILTGAEQGSVPTEQQPVSNNDNETGSALSLPEAPPSEKLTLDEASSLSMSTHDCLPQKAFSESKCSEETSVDEKVNSTAEGDSTTTKSSSESEKATPSLQTSLSVNGMKTELANALDSLIIIDSKHSKSENATETSDEPSSPDDFERELDEMLAQIHVTEPVLSDSDSMYNIEVNDKDTVSAVVPVLQQST